ncbi:MAG TPA: parallel beta-helix domain-containing protein [Terriglobia bacterium]|nr:parallel beta-helix domain-containing protein [Terriglobia bacterium]
MRVPGKMIVRSVTLPIVAAGFLVFAGCRARKPAVATDAEFQRKTQEALILAKPGSVIELPAGKWRLDRTLSLSVDRVTVRGAGMDKTILSFQGQQAGASGMLVTASDFTLEDLAIEDTAGDALKVKDATNVTIRRVRTEWTGGPKESNGSYGIYPVTSKNVLVEDSVVIGASDAGIYVGQSSNVVVRRNRVEQNVAGIEIENCHYSDVYENMATKNTGGILVFNLPDLPVKHGQYTRVFSNQVFANNTDNFAPKGNLVAKVPAGTGVMIMATKHIDVFKNTIKDNQTSNVSIVSYLVTDNPIKDPDYDPYTAAIYVHDNDLSGGGTAPSGLAIKALALAVGKPLGDILYDGTVDPNLVMGKHVAEDSRICIQNNGHARFLNFDAAGNFRHTSRDLAPYNCTYPPLEPVALASVVAAGR